MRQGVVDGLLEQILAVFDRDMIFSTADLAAHGGVWPTLGDMLANGKRVLFISGANFGAEMEPLLFSR